MNTEPMTTTPVPTTAGKTLDRRKSGRKRTIIAAGALLAVGVMVTSAAFIDSANINIGAAGGGGIGGPNSSFALEVADVDDDGNPVTPSGDDGWVSANSPQGISYTLPNAESFEPGMSSEVRIPIRNNSSNFYSNVTPRVADIGDPSADKALTRALRINIDWIDDKGNVVNLGKGMRVDDVAEKAILSPGADGIIVVQVEFPDEEANWGLQGHSAKIRAILSAVSALQ